MDNYPFELENFNPDEDKITSEVIEPEFGSADRSIARRAGLQILYELDTTAHPFEVALDDHIHARPESRAVRRLIRAIVAGVLAHRDAIDELIQQYAPEWPVAQVAVIDRNILRIAIFEYLLQKRNTPSLVIINESVHLAQIFGAENSPGFVHGVLGAMMNTIKVEKTSVYMQLFDEVTVRWDSAIQRYRNVDTGEFVGRSKVGEVRHRFNLRMSENQNAEDGMSAWLADLAHLNSSEANTP